MSHRKVYSQGSIPFSWEDKPGISKATHQAKNNQHDQCPIEYRVQALDLTSLSSSSSSSSSLSLSFSKINGSKVSSTDHDLKIPLPPCPISQPPSRSSSARGLRWQEDPFLLAYKECTKPLKNGKSSADQLRNKKASTNKVRKSFFMYFSCKNSCEVRKDNFVKLPQLPVLPPTRHKLDQNVVMGNW